MGIFFMILMGDMMGYKTIYISWFFDSPKESMCRVSVKDGIDISSFRPLMALLRRYIDWFHPASRLPGSFTERMVYLFFPVKWKKSRCPNDKNPDIDDIDWYSFCLLKASEKKAVAQACLIHSDSIHRNQMMTFSTGIKPNHDVCWRLLLVL